MQRAFPLVVCLEDPSPQHQMRAILAGCFQAVSDVLTIFAPVFGDPHAPPLPVTSILPGLGVADAQARAGKELGD